MFGWGVAENETLPRLLEKHLAIANQQIEIINAGVPGYTLLTVQEYYSQIVSAYNPDYIVIYAGWNDINSILNHRDNGRRMLKILNKNIPLRSWYVLRGRWLVPWYRKYCIRNHWLDDKEIDELNKRLAQVIKTIEESKVKDYLILTLPSYIQTDEFKNNPKKIAKQFAPYLAQEQISTSADLITYGSILAQFNEMVRRVSPDHLVDPAVRDDIFSSIDMFTDGYHPSGKGFDSLARILAQEMLKRNWTLD